MNNTIRLLRGEERLTESEYRHFQKGDTIFGNDSEPEELERWSIEDEEKAKKLSRLRCTYAGGNGWSIEEYALEYCEYGEEGEFVQGSDHDLAQEG